MDPFLQILGREGTDLIDPPAERLHVAAFDGKPGRHLMAAVSGENLPDLRHFLKHVVGFDGASAPLHPVLGAGQDENGLIIFFPHPSRNDAGEAFMAVRQKNDQYPVLSQRFLLHQGDGLLHEMFRHFLPAVVERL